MEFDTEGGTLRGRASSGIISVSNGVTSGRKEATTRGAQLPEEDDNKQTDAQTTCSG
jgi:hypothetical protein